MDQEGGGGRGVLTNPLENCKAIGFLSNTGQDPLESDRSTKPEFNVGSLKTCFLRNFDSSLPSSKKEKKGKKKKILVRVELDIL